MNWDKGWQSQISWNRVKQYYNNCFQSETLLFSWLFADQNVIHLKFLLTKNFYGSQNFWPKFYFTILLGQEFCLPKFFFDRKVLTKQCFDQENFWPKILNIPFLALILYPGHFKSYFIIIKSNVGQLNA